MMRFAKTFSLLAGLLLSSATAHAALIETPQILSAPDQAGLIDLLQRQDVQRQLVEMGVDPMDALQRVERMTAAEIAQLHNRLSELPAGGRIGVIELLLIIIILILVL